MGGWFLILLVALASTTPVAWADAAKDRADRLCEKADTAERDAKEAERKSEERQRFLKGKDGIAVGTRPTQAADTSALRQSLKARTAQAREIVSKLGQGSESANRDKGIAPGLAQYFTQMESNIGRLLQAVDACLDNPEHCTLPPITCPSPPAMPSFAHSGSADFIRQVQQTYAQAANQARQACQNLNTELRGEIERLKRESRAAAATGAPSGGGESQRFGEADLQLRRAKSLRREAVQFRQEADLLSGTRGYCTVRLSPRIDAATTHAVVEAIRSAGKRRADTGIPLDGKVVDLKAGWVQPWEKGTRLNAPGVPLPKVSVWENGEDGSLLRDKAKAGYEKAASWYREADEQVELTEFLTPPSPKDFLKGKVKEAAIDILVEISGPFGKSVKAGIKILEAVKGTTEEIGEILADAPRVIGSGSAADSQELADRANRVPVMFLNSLFDDLTSKVDLPKQRYQYKERWDEQP